MESDSQPPLHAIPPPSEPESAPEQKPMVHRVKVIQFFGRKTPIILQNDNGPCPLLAICNVLSLRNILSLSSDIPEVSQEELLALVAGQLLDGNNNIKNEDYAQNQQQNIADAIDLLPRLTTGIDVNLRFRRIDDFEFTPECAIFDLLGIALYHGWIVDSQDTETAGAIGSKSYNTLMSELVSLETQPVKSEMEMNIEDDTVDFAAATTAALGVPSPCLSRGPSFDESSNRTKKGDVEEESEVLKALKLSEEDKPSSLKDGVQSPCLSRGPSFGESSNSLKKGDVEEESEALKALKLSEEDKSSSFKDGVVSDLSLLESENSRKSDLITYSEVADKNVTDQFVKSELCFAQEPPPDDDILDSLKGDVFAQNEFSFTSEPDKSINLHSGFRDADSSCLLTSTADSDLSRAGVPKYDEAKALSPSMDGSEPMYEGEERILESRIIADYENREPVYEGEVVLAEQLDQGNVVNANLKSNGIISIREGELIKNFMESSASQLTIYGLFCLQEKVRENEICVFFRNNHFNTMFKHEGELYILATDQGYINEPDLVWEKLNEVNGDTLFMTGNFKEFKMEDPSSTVWDERKAIDNTTDFLATIDVSAQGGSTSDADWALAVALQQEEIDHQQQPPLPPPQPSQPPKRYPRDPPSGSGGGSRMYTGPQAPRTRPQPSSSSSRQESKPKDKEKCIMM